MHVLPLLLHLGAGGGEQGQAWPPGNLNQGTQWLQKEASTYFVPMFDYLEEAGHCLQGSRRSPRPFQTSFSTRPRPPAVCKGGSHSEGRRSWPLSSGIAQSQNREEGDPACNGLSFGRVEPLGDLVGRQGAGCLGHLVLAASGEGKASCASVSN